MSIRYVYKRGDTFYYQRKVPKDLLSRYDNLPHVKVNLKTNDLNKIPNKVEALNKGYEALWDAMRGNVSITPEQVTEIALQLLKQYGLKPLPHTNEDIDLDNFIESVLMPKQVAHANGDEDTYNKAKPSQYLSPTEQEALRLLNEKPKFRLKDALSLYLNMHTKNDDDYFRTYNTRIWDRLIAIVGNKPFEDLSRDDANKYVTRLIADGLKTGSVRRNIRAINAVYNHGLREKEILKGNPFAKLKIAGEGKDEIKRETFNADQLQTLRDACLAKDDDLRWALALQMDLGSRIGEVVGLTLDDIVLDHDIPHVNFEPKPWRTIKANEQRFVLLVGMALWGAKRIKETAKEGQFFAFPRYNPDGKLGKTKRDAASASLNKCLEGLKLDRTTHELRLTMRDRLRNVNTTRDVMDAVGGWGKDSIGEKYGKDYALKLLQEWMLKVC